MHSNNRQRTRGGEQVQSCWVSCTHGRSVSGLPGCTSSPCAATASVSWTNEELSPHNSCDPSLATAAIAGASACASVPLSQSSDDCCGGPSKNDHHDMLATSALSPASCFAIAVASCWCPRPSSVGVDPDADVVRRRRCCCSSCCCCTCCSCCSCTPVTLCRS